MANKEAFARLCERVCREQGWELLPTGVELRWPDGRHQVVALEFMDLDGDELVRLFTVVGDARDLAPERLELALQANARLAQGALAIRDGQLVMTHSFLLAEAEVPQIRSAISYLARAADDYERIFYDTDEH